MFKKRSFLSPLAVAVAALIGTAKAEATPQSNGAPPTTDPNEKRAVAPFQLPEFLVLSRSPVTGEMMAYHSSHQSHSSHSSHRSHYSSR